MIKKGGPFIFLLYIAALVAVVIGHNYLKYYVRKDFHLFALTSCDPQQFNCFEVDPNSAAFAFYSEPYKKVDITANAAPLCLEEHACTDFSCSEINGTCEITYCSSETLEEGEVCSNARQ